MSPAAPRLGDSGALVATSFALDDTKVDRSERCALALADIVVRVSVGTTGVEGNYCAMSVAPLVGRGEEPLDRESAVLVGAGFGGHGETISRPRFGCQVSFLKINA